MIYDSIIDFIQAGDWKAMTAMRMVKIPLDRNRRAISWWEAKKLTMVP
jgi:hypothetical protein